MSINHVFYKNNLVAEIETQASIIRQQLLDELVASGSDPVVRKRRFLMLQHLSIVQAQLINKLYLFETDDPTDYLETDCVMREMYTTVSRNA